MFTKNYLYGCIGLFLLGIIFYAFYNEYIIFNPKKSFLTIQPEAAVQKKKTTLHFFNNGWQRDYRHLLLSENNAQNAQMILNHWFEVAFDEKIIKKKIVVQNAFITPPHELIISLDQPPFFKESSTFDKWMIIEGVLKSIKENIPSIKKVRFLINHQPFNDTHLDFTNCWPAEGFAY